MIFQKLIYANCFCKAFRSGLRKALAKPLHRLISPSKAILKDSTVLPILAKPPDNPISFSQAFTRGSSILSKCLKNQTEKLLLRAAEGQVKVKEHRASTYDSNSKFIEKHKQIGYIIKEEICAARNDLKP
jgi:hypothetical protein